MDPEERAAEAFFSGFEEIDDGAGKDHLLEMIETKVYDCLPQFVQVLQGAVERRIDEAQHPGCQYLVLEKKISDFVDRHLWIVELASNP